MGLEQRTRLVSDSQAPRGRAHLTSGSFFGNAAHPNGGSPRVARFRPKLLSTSRARPLPIRHAKSKVDSPNSRAARASASEDGRRSGTRREATRRVEAIHAQELVQDDARDACPCVGIQDAGVQRTRGCVSSIELSKRTTAITPQTRYGSRPPTSRKTCRQKGQSGVRRKSSGPLESDFEQAAARPSIAARPFWRSTFSLKVRASGSS